ncbi:MAG: hypothetical protein WDO19_04140 [Bacteroidota bacterium]
MNVLRRILSFIAGSSFFLNRITYYIAGGAAIVYVLSYFFPFLFTIGHVILILLGITIRG